MIPAEGQFFENEDDPRFALVVRRLQRGRAGVPIKGGDAAAAAKKKRSHPQCSRACDPRSERSLVHDGYLDGPPISSNVYICAQGSLHICSKSACEYYGAQQDQTCHVSGIQHGTVVSSYDAGDYRTWKPLPPALSGGQQQPAGASSTKRAKSAPKKQPPQQQQQHGAKQDADKAETIVNNLLYSAMRTQRNVTAMLGNRRIASKAKQGYVYERKVHQHQLPYLSELHKRGSWALQAELPLKELERDDSLVAYYVAVIGQLSGKVRTHCVFDHRIDAEALALGTLYMLRQGYSHAGRIYLAADPFLDAHLPRINDMVFFGYDRDKITDGMRMLLALYTTTGVAPEALMLDVAQLPALGESQLIKL